MAAPVPKVMVAFFLELLVHFIAHQESKMSFTILIMYLGPFSCNSGFPFSFSEQEREKISLRRHRCRWKNNTRIKIDCK
jgi:hypothetical protein